MNQDIQTGEGELDPVAGIKSPFASARRAGQTVILICRDDPPVPAGETSSWESLGDVSVRLVAEWKRPRLMMLPKV